MSSEGGWSGPAGRSRSSWPNGGGVTGANRPLEGAPRSATFGAVARSRLVRPWTVLVASLMACAALSASARAANGPQTFAKLERVDAEPWFDGLTRVRAFLTLIQLDGRPIEDVKP